MLAALIAFAILFPLGYVVLVPESRGNIPALPEIAAGQYRVYVVDWGFHSAIVIEQPHGWTLGPPGKENSAFVEYAWGDRSFFLYDNRRLHALFASVFLPTASITYLGGLSDPPQLGGSRAVFMRYVDARTLRSLIVALEQSIQRASNGARLAPYNHPRPAFPGRFYPAHGAYIWPRDCNWWTIRRLREAGLALSEKGMFFSGQVEGRLQGFQRVPQ